MTKTMQPVLPKSSQLTPVSMGWWHSMLTETNSSLGKMMSYRSRRISVTFEPSKHIMNEQGEWDCQHESTNKKEFLHYIGIDDAETVTQEVCTACNKYYDDRINEWLAND
jgi:hypothetical protein